MATRPLNPHAIPINTRANHFIQAASCVIIVRAITQSIIVKNFYHCPVKTKLLNTPAKILLQALWQEKLDWDDSIPRALQREWNDFRENLFYLNELQIPRRVICQNSIPRALQREWNDFRENLFYLNELQIPRRVICQNPTEIQIHGFAELMAALVLAKLTSKVKASLRLIISEVFLWTDSTIVLAWIQTPPNLLKTFVANRIAQIQDLTNGNSWRHVPTSSNAADPLSRGMSAQELTRSELWWRGPEWLAKNSDCWPASVTNNMKALPELRTSNQACISVARINFVAIENFSSFPKLQRVVAYCQRFIHNCRMKEKYLSKCLTPQELFNATMLIVKVVQSESFSQELKDIRGTANQLEDSIMGANNALKQFLRQLEDSDNPVEQELANVQMQCIKAIFTSVGR
ncbi:Pao retrotransposon peptidase [Popillia japonica]|uniref:Pao retrotransposon peptidase n=1 Tax=Popillia japonica TaxID=7064 RepID=A0AAW1KFT8_POPJA